MQGCDGVFHIASPVPVIQPNFLLKAIAIFEGSVDRFVPTLEIKRRFRFRKRASERDYLKGLCREITRPN